jgi:uncharacterized RDD family membrane protein YckC
VQKTHDSVNAQADASVWSRRMRAGWIDVAILALVFLVVSVMTGGAHAGHESTPNGSAAGASATLGGVATIVWVALALIYYGASEALTGQTLGKRLMRVRVVSVAGEHPSTAAVIGRTLARIIDVLPVFYLLGFIACNTGGEPRRRIGDRIARTRVVSV